MRVTFPAETARDRPVLGPLTARSLGWLLTGIYAAWHPWHDHALPLWLRAGAALCCLGIAAAFGMWRYEDAYPTTWLERLGAHLARPRRFLLR